MAIDLYDLIGVVSKIRGASEFVRRSAGATNRDAANFIAFADALANRATEILKAGVDGDVLAVYIEAIPLANACGDLIDLAIAGFMEINPQKWTIGRIFDLIRKGSDPWKAMRLKADAVALEFGLDWVRA